MIWIIGIIIFFLFILCWLLLSPLVIKLDTRIPGTAVYWQGIGAAELWYDEEWYLNMQLLFYHKTFRMNELGKKTAKKKSSPKKKKAKKMNRSLLVKKIIRVLRSFRVTEWKLAIDADDYTLNAQLYPLNFIPLTVEHLQINFSGENYLLLKIKNSPWKILYAWFR